VDTGICLFSFFYSLW